MRVLGLDPGKVTGWAVVEFLEGSRPKLIERGDLSWDGKSVQGLFEKLSRLWVGCEPSVLAIEKPFLMRGSDTLDAIKIYTLATLVAEERWAKSEEVFPGTARLVVTGKGRRSDSDISKFVKAALDLPAQCRPGLGQHQPAAMLVALWYLVEFEGLRL